ncbi:hypothetical protein BUALT_Bualt16G0078500 [Buddleja alternifolia]|uniref:Myb/SANT-like domain-containing protein n=1 Tax=Buddleja alternifolia TaxID=168488 RepID=A0AAV6WHQ0_9LAMI|nr:hypothetical protein BUALT_Bualt16G0078500 [Buddleja alternifolia]
MGLYFSSSVELYNSFFSPQQTHSTAISGKTAISDEASSTNPAAKRCKIMSESHDTSQFMGPGHSEDANWHTESLTSFIMIMHDEVLQGNLVGANFTKSKWTDIHLKMQQACPRIQFTVKQLQGKFTRLKAKWKRYHILLTSQTGLGWDDQTHKVVGTDEQWASWLLAHPHDSGMRKKGCLHYRELTTIFLPYTATGRLARASTMAPAPGVGRRENVGVTSLGNEIEDEESRSGTPPRTQSIHTHTQSLRYTNMTNTIGTTSRARKGGEGAVLSAIKEWEKCSEKLSAGCDPKSITTVELCIDTLKEMPNIPPSLFYSACAKFEDPVRRRIFLAMPPDLRRGYIEE